MKIDISPDKKELGRRAARHGAALLHNTLAARGAARIIVATGASQFEMIEHLVQEPAIDWQRVTIFHLDEYVGLGPEHPASFRKYLRERLVARLPQSPAAFHAVDGDAADLGAECARLGALINAAPIDVAFVGIGENGHLAFNDPPADFETDDAYIVVNLDEACRRQQLGEGWFPALSDVPQRALSMSIRQIMRSQAIVATIPDARKAAAVANCLQGPISNLAPASILQQHGQLAVFLDNASASQLN
jgi:glucosamine-6-phosphate deaminase